MNKGWILFITLSFLLLTGYLYIDTHHHEELAPYLKNLSFLQHFLIHYTVGVFFGLLIILYWKRIYKKKYQEAYTPYLLSAAVLWSHFPDLLAAIRGIPIHDTWEIIFFFHTLVDEFSWLLWIFLVLDVVLVYVWKK